MSGTAQNTNRPSWALGICDICGFVFPLNELKRHVFDQKPDGLLVCSADDDLDNPQLQLGRAKIFDPQSLRDPRPDTGRPGSTGLFGWFPIGNPLTNIQCQIGTITVLIV